MPGQAYVVFSVRHELTVRVGVRGCSWVQILVVKPGQKKPIKYDGKMSDIRYACEKLREKESYVKVEALRVLFCSCA